ncbi:MAG: hypothetical protein OXH66_02945 [Gemmatimonadetes bacterium]|nr:hypothetical protein [Gemmatimonadota bacterium]
MSEVIDSIAQPFQRRKGIHMEAEEEEEQTYGSLELLRLLQFGGQELLKEAMKIRVDRVVSLDPNIGARRRQRYGHPVDTPVSDEDQ